MTALAQFIAFPHDYTPAARCRKMSTALRAVAARLEHDATINNPSLADALIEDFGPTLEFMEANDEFGTEGLKL